MDPNNFSPSLSLYSISFSNPSSLSLAPPLTNSPPSLIGTEEGDGEGAKHNGGWGRRGGGGCSGDNYSCFFFFHI